MVEKPARQQLPLTLWRDRALGLDFVAECLNALNASITLRLMEKIHPKGYGDPWGFLKNPLDCDTIKRAALDCAASALGKWGKPAVTVERVVIKPLVYGHLGHELERRASSEEPGCALAFAWFPLTLPKMFGGGTFSFTRGGGFDVEAECDRLITWGGDEPFSIRRVTCYSASPLDALIVVRGWIIGA